jgi:hypothetical protein
MTKLVLARIAGRGEIAGSRFVIRLTLEVVLSKGGGDCRCLGM